MPPLALILKLIETVGPDAVKLGEVIAGYFEKNPGVVTPEEIAQIRAYAADTSASLLSKVGGAPIN